MQVNGLSGAGSKTAGIKMAQKMDSFSINIKNEIARKQKEQQEISSNKSLSAEEKMKKRQEIQRQINDLYNQLRQHQIEQRREKQQAEQSGFGAASGEPLPGQRNFDVNIFGKMR